MATTYIKQVKGKPQSPNYYAVWIGVDGKRKSRSTETTKKREAQRIANGWDRNMGRYWY